MAVRDIIGNFSTAVRDIIGDLSMAGRDIIGNYSMAVCDMPSMTSVWQYVIVSVI